MICNENTSMRIIWVERDITSRTPRTEAGHERSWHRSIYRIPYFTLHLILEERFLQHRYCGESGLIVDIIRLLLRSGSCWKDFSLGLENWRGILFTQRRETLLFQDAFPFDSSTRATGSDLGPCLSKRIYLVILWVCRLHEHGAPGCNRSSVPLIPRYSANLSSNLL